MVYWRWRRTMVSTASSGPAARLRKIEGQIVGVRGMIEDGRPCPEILIQLEAIVGAVKRVEEALLGDHLQDCVRQALDGRGRRDRDLKIEEIVRALARFREHG